MRLWSRSTGLYDIARELAVDVVLGLYSVVQTSYRDPWDLDTRSSPWENREQSLDGCLKRSQA